MPSQIVGASDPARGKAQKYLLNKKSIVFLEVVSIFLKFSGVSGVFLYLCGL